MSPRNANKTETNTSNVVSLSSCLRICGTPDDNDAQKRQQIRKKKTILKSIKEIFSSNTKSSKSSSSSISGLSHCTRTVINSLGAVSIGDDQDDDDEGYGDYEEYKGYSSSDFLDSGSSSSSHYHHDNNHNSDRIVPLHAKDSIIHGRDTHIRGEITGKVIDNSTTRQKHMSKIFNAKSLIGRGKAYYRQKFYKDALSHQLQASELIQSAVCDYEFADAHLHLQTAVVEYDISKTKYALLNKPHTSQSENNLQDNQTERNVAHDKVQNKKVNLLNKKVVYYRDELLRLNGRCNVSGGCSATGILNLERVGYILYLLHTLGNICVKKLARYSSALNYYNEALELEIEVLSFLETQDEDVNMDNDELERKKRRITIQVTRNKIGKIHFLTGRLDLALKQGFLPITTN